MRLKKLEQLLKDTSQPDVSRVLAYQPEMFGAPFSTCFEVVQEISYERDIYECGIIGNTTADGYSTS